ncbi:transcriptional regulator [Brucella anthropi]|uniref:transcriptional regulator n=1 Tax=Brucella/Ochrobactrum group TaxID=2826938 RepID=UPI00124D7051|nr:MULTISPECIES: transcriptional regulator [Brucella/Ochrobactrum group]KAB2759379.1 transcriptional regulator [Brucella anthropi]KAB2775496.1 transcriptional regulator [Brucella anthropi]MCQ9146727.1 transcriptional regulator [Ochrobactrum sp. BTU2]UGQ20665.1 transcriptional regulator [Brucella anthropi]
MADFVAVLKKTIDAQADKSPELRQRVYAKARATIEQKLVTANASQAVAVRQRNILEDAIAEVEAFYAPPAATAPEEPVDDALEDFLQEANQDAAERVPSHEDDDEPAFSSAPRDERRDNFSSEVDDAPAFAAERSDDWKLDRAKEKAQARRSEYIERTSKKEQRSYKGLIAALVAVLVLGGAGYAVWANKGKIQELASSLGRSDAPATGSDTGTHPEDSTTPPADTNTATTGGEQTPEQPQQPAGEPKMTQRLMPDGSETDSGSAGAANGIGEGTSTAASTPAPAETNTQTGAQPGQNQTVAVGQQALLYEERGGAGSDSVERGNVVWSTIEESPEDGQPAEPAVRATVTMPTSKVELKMTIRKNTDQSIPASHLIELVFTVPEGFTGGVVDNVQRITFKDTEQAAGNPLIAVPSKIGDNFFIVWLNDARTAQDTNLSLMRRLQWIDIPISYRNGRRALISLEKGVPGEKAFNDVLGTN